METINLNGEWQFAFSSKREITEESGIPILPSPEAFSARIPVPACWDDQSARFATAGFLDGDPFNEKYKPFKLPVSESYCPDATYPFIEGVVWYRKSISSFSSDSLLTLEFDGVRLDAFIWLNGKFVAKHMGHSTPFKIVLPDEAIDNEHENVLTIAVSNTRTNRTGMDLRGWKGRSGGIMGGATLRQTEKAQIIESFAAVSSKGDSIHFETETATKDGSFEELELRWDLSADGDVLKSGVETVNSALTVWESDLKDVPLWSDLTPNLLKLNLSLHLNGELLDSTSDTVGFRTIAVSGTSAITLNGEPLYLRGITEHCYFPETRVPPRNKKYYENAVSILKELGFNWIRCHTWVPTPEFLEAADEAGMLFQVEPPVGYEENEWVEIVKSCRRHPSVVIYCCGNEELLDEDKIESLRDSERLLRKHCPNALFNPQEALRGIEYVWSGTDLGEPIATTPFKHNPKRLDALREFSDVFGHYSWGYLSYISSKGERKGLERRMRVYKRPCLAHEIGIHGSYMDISLEKRCENTAVGSGLYKEMRLYLEREGLIDRAAIYFKNSCAWQRIQRKHTIETARKCSTLAGYDYLGATDHHHHQTGYTGGIMNEFYELKPGNRVEDVLTHNAPTVLLLDNDNDWIVSEGESRSFDLIISKFGDEDLKTAEITWSLDEQSGKTIQSGKFDTANLAHIKKGDIAPVGTVEFTLPATSEASKLILRAKLKHADGVVANSWNFWLFPSDISARPLDSELTMITSLDETVPDRLANGEKILLFGAAHLPAIKTEFQVGLPGRTNGNLATIIKKHPLMDAFPHDGFCDWQFKSMLNGADAVVFNDLRIPFNPIIEVVSSFKVIQKQALLFEFAVGKGKILVCSLNLKNDDPAAEFLKSRLVEYALSNDFEPENSMTPGELTDVITANFANYGNNRKDMAFDPNAQL